MNKTNNLSKYIIHIVLILFAVICFFLLLDGADGSQD